MKRTTLRAAAVAALVLAAGLGDALAQQVTLRSNIESSGRAVTLSDVFENAGAAGARAIGPGVPDGQTRTFTPRTLQAAASAAGLQWTPPAGVTSIIVSGRGASAAPQFQRASTVAGDLAVRRGETILLIYATSGLRVTARGRATTDGAVGDTVRVVNLQSNRTVDAEVTGTGAATVRAN